MERLFFKLFMNRKLAFTHTFFMGSPKFARLLSRNFSRVEFFFTGMKSIILDNFHGWNFFFSLAEFDVQRPFSNKLLIFIWSYFSRSAVPFSRVRFARNFDVQIWFFHGQLLRYFHVKVGVFTEGKPTNFTEGIFF